MPLPPWASHVDHLPLDDPDRSRFGLLGDVITSFVGHLANEFPNPNVNRLMGHVWNLLGSRTVNVAAVGARVPTMSFAVLGSGGINHPVLMVPDSWLRLNETEPVMAAGAVVYCGSQAVDFFNGHLLTNRSVCMERSAAYEAEFLLGQPEKEGFNDYQRRILTSYPKGLPDYLRYEMKPSPPPRGSNRTPLT